MLLNAEQEANSIYDDKVDKAGLLLNEAKSESKSLKRSTIGGQRGSQKIHCEEVTLNLSQNVRSCCGKSFDGELRAWTAKTTI